MWVDLHDPTVASVWPDSAEIEPSVLDLLLTAAYEVCSAYAPPAPEGIPASYQLAQVLQARQIWSDLAGGNSQEIGADDYAISSFPLVVAARQLLRPKVSALGLIR